MTLGGADQAGSGNGNKRPRLDGGDGSEANGEAVRNAAASPQQVAGEGAGGEAARAAEAEALLEEVKTLRRKEGEWKKTEQALLEQLMAVRSEKEAMQGARGGLQAALRKALGAVDEGKSQLAASEGHRKALALQAVALQQAVGAATPEAVLPALQTLRAGQAAAVERAGKLRGELENAEAEAKAARAALSKEVDKTREANRRASAAEKSKKELEDKVRDQKRALEIAEADKAKVLKVRCVCGLHCFRVSLWFCFLT
jgi:chromosome segregation ATPase